MRKTVVEEVAVPVFRVLIIEDNRLDAELTVGRLASVPDFSFRCDRARDLHEALIYLETLVPDIILCDLNLPDSKSRETLDAVRNKAPKVPIVVTSTSTDEVLRRELLEAGAQDCIDKNEPAERLLARSLVYAKERHEARRHQSDLEAIVTFNPDGIVVFDESGLIMMQNEAARLMCLTTIDGRVNAALRDAVATPNQLHVSMGGNGNELVAEVHAAITTWNGEPAHLAVLRDRTQEHVLIERVRQSEKLNAIGRLAGGIAHDFNNLLTVIIGYTEMLMNREVGPDELAEMVQEMHEAGERAKKLTEQLLTFGGRSDARPEVLDVNDVMRKMHRMLRRIIGDDVDLAYSGEDATLVRIGQGRLEQIAMNLVVNARDALPDGGRIEIATDCLSVAAIDGGIDPLPPGRYVRLSVSDNGIGMDEATRNQIFEPYFTTKSDGGGTGLGLSTVYGIVRQHGGKVSVSSEPDNGTTFEVMLPAIDSTIVLDTVEEAAFDVTPGSGSLIYVEDDESVRRVVEAGLRSGGYEVTALADPFVALALVERQGWTFDLVVSDVSMPGMNGITFVKALRDLLGDHVPAVFVSGLADAGEGRDDSDPVLRKPFRIEELLAQVRSCLDRKVDA